LDYHPGEDVERLRNVSIYKPLNMASHIRRRKSS